MARAHLRHRRDPLVRRTRHAGLADNQPARNPDPRRAQARTCPPASATAARAQLKGSPVPLADLHGQASHLLGGESAFAARIKALRGYPIVVNVWASWCTPCRDEFDLFAAASAHYGRSVAFLGVDYNDSTGNAEAFLRQHPVSYPSYQLTSGQLDSLLPAGIEGTPTTIYINPAGHVYSIHTGAYVSQGTLDGDIDSFASPSR